MPYTYDSALHIKDVISNRGKNVQVYIVEDPLRLMELILSIDSLPKMGRDAKFGIPTTYG